MPRNGTLTFEKLAERIHPPDREVVKRQIEATRAKPGPYEIDFRIQRNDEVCWIVARGLGANEGIVDRIKYGSLSVAAGSLDVSGEEHNGTVSVVWTEQGGPPVTAPTGLGGFGSRLIARSVVGQLGGTIEFSVAA